MGSFPKKGFIMLAGTNPTNGYDSDMVHCVMKYVDGVPCVVMNHRTLGKALDSMNDMTSKGQKGLWVQSFTLHN